MTRRKHPSTGAGVKTICTTLFALALSSSPAFAEYRAWFAPWDYIGDFQPGDISEDFSEMTPPDEACGLRISTPSYYAWTDDVEGIVGSHDLYQDVIIWIDNPDADCDESFSVTKADMSATYSPPDGAVSMEIHTNYGAYWVNKNGYYLYTCGGGEKCVGADDFTIPPQDIWSTLTASAFADVSGSTIDPRRQCARLQRGCRPGAAGGAAADAAAEPDRDPSPHTARRPGVVGAGSRRRCDPNTRGRAHGSRLVRVARSEGLLRRVVCRVHQRRPRRRGERFAHARSLVPVPPAISANHSRALIRAIAAVLLWPYVSRGDGPSPARGRGARTLIDPFESSVTGIRVRRRSPEQLGCSMRVRVHSNPSSR